MLHLRPSQVQQEDRLDEGCACRSPEKQMGGELAGVWFYAKIGFPDPEGSSEESVTPPMFN